MSHNAISILMPQPLFWKSRDVAVIVNITLHVDYTMTLYLTWVIYIQTRSHAINFMQLLRQSMPLLAAKSSDVN